MRSSTSRLFMALALGVVAACGPQAQQSAKVESQTDQTKPAPPPSASQPAAPATTPPSSPAPATPPPTTTPASPPTAAAPPPMPAPAAQEPPKATAETPQVLVISVAQANVREKPDTKARILHVLTKGTKLTVVSKGNQWYRVRLGDGSEGWIAESVVKPGPAN